MATSVEQRKEFSARLHKACDMNPNVPQIGHGRQQYIADSLMVTAEAVSKWFTGKAKPKERLGSRLATLLDTDYSWLYLGIKPESTGKERRALSRESEGAVHLVWGLIALAGGYIGMLPPTDPRSEYVQFTATVKGITHSMHVCLAQEVSVGVYEIGIPVEYPTLRVVAVIPLGAGKFNYIDMPTSHIDAHKTRKAGDYCIKIERTAAGRYVTNGTPWPKITVFGDFTEHET